MIRTIVLHGSLRKFGAQFRLHVDTPRDVVRALSAQLPGFEQEIRAGQFKVRAAGAERKARYVTAETAAMRLGRLSVVHIYPAAAGSKKGMSTAKIILGVALLGVGLVGGFAAGGLGAAALSFGSGASAFAISWGQVALWGASFALTGLSSALAGSPSIGAYEAREAPEDRPSFLFNGAVNSVNEGVAVPWVFGKRVRVGSVVISGGIWSEQTGETAQFVEADTTGSLRAEITSGKVVGSKKSKKQQRPPEESPNNLRSNSLARLIDLIGEGELELCEGDRSVLLEGTPAENDDGTRNFKGLKVTWRSGLPDQPYIPGSPGVMQFKQVTTTVTASTPVVRTIVAPRASRLLVNIRFPQGIYRFDTSGDQRGTTLGYSVDVKPEGGAWETVVARPAFSGKAGAGYQITESINLPQGVDTWDVRVNRTYPDDPSERYQTEFMWADYTAVWDYKLQYPYSACAGLELDAQEFGGEIAGRQYDVRKVNALIPSNYDPELRTYSGIWDGTWKTGCTDNPALAWLDLMQSPRYGAGRDIPPELLDPWGIYAAAQVCDQMVSDGKGGLRPRFTFNGSLSSRENALQVLTALAATFAALPYWGAGAVRLAQDRPKAIAKHVNPSNVIGGDFDYEGTGLSARHSVVACTFNDPDNASKPALAYAVDTVAQQKIGLKQRDIYKWGCIYRSEAQLFAEWELDTNQNLRDGVTYRAGLDHADLEPGDIVAISDPTIAGGRFGGCAISCTASTVTLDQDVTLDPGEDYTLSIAGQDGKPIDRAITNAPGTYSTVTISPDLPSDLPVPGAVWAILSSAVEPRLFDVRSNKWAGGNEFQISAVSYDPDKWDRVEGKLIVRERNYSRLPSGPLPPPSGVVAKEYLKQVAGLVRAAVSVSWEAPNDARVVGYEFGYMRPGDVEYTWNRGQTAVTAEILDVQPGAWSFLVRAYTAAGLRSIYAALDVALLDRLAPPSDVASLRIAVQGTHAIVAWDRVPDLDVVEYEIRHSAQTVGATWETTVFLATSQGPQEIVPALGGTYMIKAVNTTGRQSKIARTVVLDPAALEDVNIVVTLQESPAWAGTKTGLSVYGGVLRLSGDVMANWTSLSAVDSLEAGIAGLGSSGVYECAQIVDLGARFPMRVSAAITAFAGNVKATMATWSSLAALSSMAGVGADDFSVVLQIALTDDDPGGAPVWSDWEDVTAGSYDRRAAKFRLLVDALVPDVQVYVTGLAITCDMQDRIIRWDDITIPAAGITLAFDPPFKGEPVVHVTPQDGDAADVLVKSGKTRESITIQILNGGLGVTRTADVSAHSYGVEI